VTINFENLRIIPRLDIKGTNVVKGVFTEGLKVVGDPKKLATRYYKEGADEIMLMDIVASLYQRNLDFDLLKSVTDGIFIPITADGGIRSIGDIDNAMRAGADKVAINTHFIKNPRFLSEAVHKFGAQCVVLSVEAKRIGHNKWEAYTDGGRERTGRDVVGWVREAIDIGVGEVVITSIDHDGTRKGFDTELISAITSFATVPIVAHGGGGNYKTFSDILELARPDALAAASVFHFQDYTISELKKYLSKAKFNVRL